MNIRIDKLLVQKNLAQTRAKAQNLIKLGAVVVNGKVIDKNSLVFGMDDNVVVTSDYEASLGSIKLNKAVSQFGVDIADKVCLDIGASNGGFTQVLLKNNAQKVYALDVGECALPDYLKNDKKVVPMRANARYIKKEDFVDSIDLCVIDVSFISLKLILPNIFELLPNNAHLVALIKPQFECGKQELTKSGIVKSKIVQEKVVKDIINFAKSLNFKFIDCIEAPHPFKEKNQEYLLYLCK